MGDVPRDPLDDEPLPRIDSPEQLCDAIAELVETLEENDLIDEAKASDLQADIYGSVKLANLPEEEEEEE